VVCYVLFVTFMKWCAGLDPSKVHQVIFHFFKRIFTHHCLKLLFENNNNNNYSRYHSVSERSETSIGARYGSVDTLNLEFEKYLSILIFKESKEIELIVSLGKAIPIRNNSVCQEILSRCTIFDGRAVYAVGSASKISSRASSGHGFH
jgi:hypothetical protein